MKRSLYFVYTIFVIILLAACVPPTVPAGAPAAQNQADSNAFPVTLDHKYGSTTITAKPERIVTVGLTDHDALLALGIVPVGTTEWFGGYPGSIWPWAQDELAALGGAVPEAVGGESVNFEKIAALQPDLILALYAGVTQEQYDLLAQIAPTVAQPADYVDYGIPWQELTLTVGKAVGKAKQAQALVDEVEAQFAQVQADHPEFVGATAVATMAWQGIYLYGPQDVRSRLLTALGFVLPEGIEAITGSTFGGNLSLERADLLDTDVIIWIDPQEAEGVLGGPVYQALPVHTEGREVLLSSSDDPVGGATSFISVLSLPYLLEQLTPMLVAALDGDPATTVVTAAAEAAPADTATATDCAAGFRLFDHELLVTDPVCIPVDPQRVLPLDMTALELMLITAQTPMGTAQWILDELPILLPDYAAVLTPLPGFGYPADLEQVAALQPDLILAPADTLDVELATQIAPVIVPDQRIYEDWKLGVEFWCAVMNMPELYDQLAAAYDQRVAELQAALGDPSELEVSVISASTYGIWLWMPDSSAGHVLADVGLGRPEAQTLVGEAAIARYGEKQYIEISEERLDLVDGDAIFYFTYAAVDPDIAAEESTFLKTFNEKPLWQALGAVKGGNAFFVGGHWWRSQTYLLANKMIDDLFANLTDTTATTPTLPGQ